jgi:hypothetical protein
MRYGTSGSVHRDYTVWTINPYVNIETGDTFAVRQVGGCAPLQAASYLEDYCTAAAPTPTPTPTPAPVDEVAMKVALPYTLAEFTAEVQVSRLVASCRLNL